MLFDYFRAGINNLRSGCTVFLKEKKLEIKGEINKKKKKDEQGLIRMRA